MTEPNRLVLGEGDRIKAVLIEKTQDSEWVMRWDVKKLDGSLKYQNFWTNESVQRLNTLWIVGQFIKTIAIVDGKIRIILSNDSSIQFPLASSPEE